MRILLLIPHLSDDVTFRIVSAGLGAEYHRRGHAVTVAGVFDAHHRRPRREILPWGEIRKLGWPFPASSRRSGPARFAAELLPLARESDFIHVQTNGVWRAHLSVALDTHRLAQRPHGVTVQDFYGPYSDARAAADFRRLLGQARWVGCLSRFLCREVLAEMPELAPRLHEIPNGCEIKGTSPHAPAPFSRPFILIIARHSHYKGIDILLMAWQGAAQRWPGVDLVVAGPLNRYRPGHYERLARVLGLERRVHFLGATSVEKTHRLLRDCLFYVQASRRESFGIALREAMAAGKAVVATRSGGLEEAVEDGRTGLLVPAQDPLALEDKMALLLSDAGLRLRLGESARRQSYRWRWDDVAGRYLALMSA